MRTLLLAALAVSCSTETLVPRKDGVVAEVHLHQYELGSHATAGFVRAPVPVREELDEMLIHFATPATSVEGVCKLELPPNCTPSCPGDTEYCSEGRCVPYKPLQFENGGPVRVLGSSSAKDFTLIFDPRNGRYRSDLAPTVPLYAAGDRLRIEADTFAAELVAPAMPVVHTPLVIPEGAYELRWDKGDGQIAARLYAVSPSGAAAFIVCLDDDRGTMTLPASMIARLPAPPRTVTLNVERRARRKIQLAAGKLAVITVAATYTRDRKD